MEEPKDRKVHTSAVIIMPPKEQWEQIQAVRSKHDKAFERWMPHINMVYPFVPESEFAEAAKVLTEAMRDVAPFDVSLAAFDHFSHSKTSKTIYLKPDAQGSAGIRKVHAKLEAAFPKCTDLSAKSALGFQPHLTIAQAQSADGCDKMIQSLFKGWRAVQWTVGELYVISRADDSTPFEIKHTIKLGGVAEAKEEQAVEKEEKADLAASFYQIAGNDLRINCTWEEDAYDTAAQQTASKILLVIDISGSMCTDLEAVKAAVRYMLGNGITKPDVIVYSTTARFCTAEQMLALKAEGGTSFEAALNKITEYVKDRKPGEKIACIFMTDGEDTSSTNLNKAKADFKAYLSDCVTDLVMHTIGFGKNHCRALLAELAKLGKREGVYRYAEGKGTLDAKFSELFDFIEMNIKRTLLVNGNPVSVDAERGPSGELTIDAFLRLDQVDPERKVFNNSACTIAMAEGASVVLQFAESDAFFALKRIEETAITEQHQLQKLQAQMGELTINKVPRSQRNKFLEQKATVQAKLDQYHTVFAEVARGAIKGDNLAAQLLSLRHETKFANARRARVMAQRAQANAGAIKQIESKLKLLKPDLEKFKALDLTCPLSGTTIQEAMGETNNDFFCFALRVTRPEHAIEAPTQLSVQKLLVGTYSNEAFVQASKFAVQSVGGAQAHGGFAIPNAEVAPEVGLFKGPDGEKMNACLPLYINDDHWARVALQIKPVLGYFFTLDPLGFRADQYIALYCILGHMLCLRANGQFVSEWADWLIADFAKLCAAIKPLALQYLKSGGYTGRIRGDILEDFIASPLDRTKEAVQNLMVVVGWEYGTGVSTAPATAERYITAFTEELWRRNLSTAYHAAPTQMAGETLEKLLLEPTEGDISAPAAAGDEDKHANKPQKEREFEEFAKFKFGKLSKAKQAEAAKQWSAKGPEIEGLLQENHGYQECKLLKYEEHAARLDALVAEELAKIKAANDYVAALYGQRPLGAGFSGKMKWLMLVQALRFHTNASVNSGVASGAYKNTFDNTADDKLAVLVKDLHEDFERKRKETWAAVVRGRNEVLTARRIASTRDLHAFCGRLMLSCPTRGGPVFDALMALLCTGQVNGDRIPLLYEKIRAVMTGRVRFSEDVDERVMSNGESYVHLNPETAKRLSEVLGKELWARIESEMIGTWGWVYRVSDLPNRHGFHNSHPNPSLRKTFTGFKLN